MILEELSVDDWESLEKCIRESIREDWDEFFFSEFMYIKNNILNPDKKTLTGLVASRLVRCLRLDFREIPKYINVGGPIQRGSLSFRLMVGK